jgi:hypothetical protein
MSELTDTHRAVPAAWCDTVVPAVAHDPDPDETNTGDRRAVVSIDPAGPATAAGTTREELGEAQTLRQLRAEVAARLERGDSLDSVERELIVPSRLSEERKSALWLYGWSLPKLERRRAALPYVESRARQDRQRRSPRFSYLAGDYSVWAPALDRRQRRPLDMQATLDRRAPHRVVPRSERSTRPPAAPRGHPRDADRTGPAS